MHSRCRAQNDRCASIAVTCFLLEAVQDQDAGGMVPCYPFGPLGLTLGKEIALDAHSPPL